MNGLTEGKHVRFFEGDEKKRLSYIAKQKGRWKDDSEFIRAACQFFMRCLDEEQLLKQREKKQARKDKDGEQHGNK